MFSTAALNHEEIKRDPERISKNKYFLKKYSWNRIKYLSNMDDWKTFEKNNLETALNVLYIQFNVLKYNLLIFPNIAKHTKC